MERTQMETPSALLVHLNKLFSEAQYSVALAEPKNEFSVETGAEFIGVADEEMRVWWALIEHWRARKDENSLGQANYDALVAIFRTLVIWKFDKPVINADDELTMYKQWVIGTSTPQSRLTPFEHAGHFRQVTKF